MKHFIYIFSLISTISYAQINNNSTRSNSFGDLQLRRYASNDMSWKRALVVGYNPTNNDAELHLNYGGDFKIGTRVHGNKFIVQGNVGIGTTNPGAKLEVEQSNSNTSTVFLSNSFNNKGFRTGHSGFATFFGYQQNNNTTSGNAYGTLMGLNTFYNGSSFYSDNQYIDPSSILLQDGGIRFHTNDISAIGNFNPSERLRITKGGNIGIGTKTPDQKLTVQGSVNIGGTGNALLRVRHIEGKHHISTNFDNLFLNYNSGKDVYIGNPWNNSVRKSNVLITGNVGIGTKTPKEKLSVNGNIRAKEVKVELENWPDYVFASQYDLMPLTEVKNHIVENGHLPNIPNAATVIAEGIDLGEMNAKLLQKIEELTLYTLQQEEKLQTQQHTIKTLMERLTQIESQISPHENNTP